MTIPDKWITRAAGAPRNYDTAPTVLLPAPARVHTGSEFWESLRMAAAPQPLAAIDCYPGVDVDDLATRARIELPGWNIVNVEDAAIGSAELNRMFAHHLTDDRVFGRMAHFELAELYDSAALSDLESALRARSAATLVIGWGAALAAPEADVLVLADLPRWEIQRRQRAGQGNWHCDNGNDDRLRKYKRGFFIEWRIADRHKTSLFDDVNWVIDSTRGFGELTALNGDNFRAALSTTAQRPFRVVPYFDPGVWGGYWMESMIDLPAIDQKYAWCFDCVPEENSLMFADADGRRFETPSINLVLREPYALLGERTVSRFGAEFPIRFDFLDTMGGGNLSLQVHPLTDYISKTFGMTFTQDESYYILDCEDDAVVYLGVKDGVDAAEMMSALAAAQSGDSPFPAEDYINTFPVAKHDHFAIPSGTVHSSGANAMVLEISATPFIFTFKLWDWGRLGLDGVPRPVHLAHGAANIAWERRTEWVATQLVDRTEVLSDDPGHREERTGLHELEFIETRRHWFDRPIELDTHSTLNVLNLVEGTAARVVSPDSRFAPFEVHYAETFIVPAAVGPYRVEPLRHTERCGIIVASVRGTEVT